MLDCQHIRPIGPNQKLPTYYLSLNKQPLRVYFGFLPKHTHRSSIGTVAITISVAGRYYGPYMTSIATTTAVWQGRGLIAPSKSSREITDLVRGVNHAVETAWHTLLMAGEPLITGEMILEKAGLENKEVSHA